MAEVKAWLLDTGPIVAYLDRGDDAHDQTVRALDPFAGQLYTTSAVVTECMHFVASLAGGPEILLEFLIAARVHIAECTSFRQLQEAVRRMRKYDDIPMDFADATLVLLAESIEVTHICTLDRTGFSAYRTAGNKPFVLVLEAPSQ